MICYSAESVAPGSGECVGVLYPILGGTPYETDGEWDLLGCPCGGRESRKPCRMAVAIVTIRRRTEL